ncbi:N-alpha-acetyltransferase 30 isoform X2 [Huso huso]|uniref:N-alpha-acetyltransferase 30 isoform X2 n=1 Tax=Huso huso TaxID=61971 RepID=A0ABR0Z1Y6_HUSHU
MAEVPPGPSALPASPAEIIPFLRAGRALPGEGQERGCGRGGDTATPGAGQQHPESEGKGSSKLPQNCLYSHPSSQHLHPAQQQQLNGMIGGGCAGTGAEAGLQNYHSRLNSHLHQHHPAHRPNDSPRGPAENCDSIGGVPDGLPENNNCSSLNSNRSLHPLHNHSPFANNYNSINSKRAPKRGGNNTTTITGQQAETQLGWTGGHSRTDPRCLALDMDEDEEGDGLERAGPGAQGSVVELAAALDASCTVHDAPGPGTDTKPVSRTVSNSSLEEEGSEEEDAIRYVRYESELQMPDIMRLITKDLSEPYSIYTYRYFIHNWPQLCFLAMVREECVGAIVCKLDMHKKMFRRGYIAMLAVDSKYRRKGIGTNLVKKAIYAMVDGDCDEVVLETEITNKSALKLYENLGFVRDKRLFRYYLNGVDALRLKLWLR